MYFSAYVCDSLHAALVSYLVVDECVLCLDPGNRLADRCG